MHLTYDWEDLSGIASADREKTSVLTCLIFTPSTPYSSILEEKSTTEFLDNVLRLAAIAAEANRINNVAKSNLAFEIITPPLNNLISKNSLKSPLFFWALILSS